MNLGGLRALTTAISLSAAVGCRPISDEDAPVARRDPRGSVTGAPTTPQRSVVSGPPAPVAGLPDFASIAERLGPSVVTVVATLERSDDEPGNRVLRGIGSGMIVSIGGQVLTSEHVVASAAKVDIELANHTRTSARVVATDDLLDLALLELETPLQGLQPVVFRDRVAVPGEWVMAIGQPFGLGHTVTVGVISGLGRDYRDLGKPAGLRGDGLWSFIQTDASVNIGNSGGPLVDTDGEVVGVTTAVRSDGQGLAFAVPAPMARRFLDEVWTYGRVRHARLGIKADNLGPEGFQGRLSAVRVTAVEAGGPAARAGLEEGDVILSIDDQPVTRVSEVAYLTQIRGVGAHVDVVVIRPDEAPRRLRVIPSEGR
ncbi:MAG: trypsin-like peptidase domain-containing protein [Nannocystaceae bacterium]